jgi:hypothetical protein
MHTVWYQMGARYFKVFKVGFGGDGSYYVTAPYHPLETALIGKVEVNYALERPAAMKESIAQAMQLAVLDDDEKRLKLSHHPDGFLQFSGEGIVSGRQSDGTPKGIGVFSWKLDRPTYGPSFGISFYRPEKLGRQGTPKPGDVIFDSAELEHMRMPGFPFLDVRFAGHYFPPRFRSFVRQDAGGYRMSIVNPESYVIQELKVILASKDSRFPGVIGLTAEPMEIGYEGFFMSSSTGSLRRSSAGDLIGDQLFCLYPVPADVSSAKLVRLNFANLPAPPYKAPPGSGVMPSSGQPPVAPT